MPLPNYEIHAQYRIVSADGEIMDTSGLSSIKARLNLAAGDELTLAMPAQDIDGNWRQDFGMWAHGAVIRLDIGYDGDLDPIQRFEIISHKIDYPSDGDAVSLTIKAVSELARASRNTAPRLLEGSDRSMLDEICAEYGWTNGVTAAMKDPGVRLKKSGDSDLSLLKLMSQEAGLGGPRVDLDNRFVMPEPSAVDPEVFTRGSIGDMPGWRALHAFAPERHASFVNKVSVVGWDPDAEKFIEVIFRADSAGGQPAIVYRGPPSRQPTISEDVKTQTLILSALDDKADPQSSKSKELLASGMFMTDLDAEDLAKRWFKLREKLSRWASIRVDGLASLYPYRAIRVEGDMANTDRGLWLPLWIEHTYDEGGWMTSMKAVRIVTEPTLVSE